MMGVHTWTCLVASIDVIGLQVRLAIMESKELHSRDANEEHTTFTNGCREVVHQIAYW